MANQLFLTASARALDIYRAAFKAGKLGSVHGDVVGEAYRLARLVYRRRAGRATIETLVGFGAFITFVAVAYAVGLDTGKGWAQIVYLALVVLTTWRAGASGAYRESARLLNRPLVINLDDQERTAP